MESTRYALTFEGSTPDLDALVRQGAGVRLRATPLGGRRFRATIEGSIWSLGGFLLHVLPRPAGQAMDVRPYLRQALPLDRTLPLDTAAVELAFGEIVAG